MHRRTLVSLAGLILLSFGCGEADSGIDETEESQALVFDENAESPVGEVVAFDEQESAMPVFLIDLPNQHAVDEFFADGVAHVESSDAFQQVSWMMDAGDVSGLEFQARRQDGSWGPWVPVEITFEEGIMKNALIRLDEPARELKMRGGEEIYSTQFEFYEDVIARSEFLPNPKAPQLSAEAMRAAARSSVAPASLVISRSQWGATNPDKICGNVVTPYRMAIHHTYNPSNDGGDPAARMRSMQSYHMNSLGWCDIGYHFIVSQSGHIYQGRSRSDRPGAHVGGQNSGNVGISFIADFTTQTPTDTQLNAGAAIMEWAADTHGINLVRSNVKGHREHSGQSTSCPGGMVGYIDELISRASGGAVTPPANDPPAYDPPANDPPANDPPTNGGGGGTPGGGYSVQSDSNCSTTGSPLEAPTTFLVLLGLVAMARRGRADRIC